MYGGTTLIFKEKLCTQKILQTKSPHRKTIHLTYGSDLEHQYENTKALYEAIPAFICKPLFIKNKDGYSLFGQDFFEGKAIDDLYNECKIDEGQVTKILEKVHSIFQNLENLLQENVRRESLKNFAKLF